MDVNFYTISAENNTQNQKRAHRVRLAYTKPLWEFLRCCISRLVKHFILILNIFFSSTAHCSSAHWLAEHVFVVVLLINWIISYQNLSASLAAAAAAFILHQTQKLLHNWNFLLFFSDPVTAMTKKAMQSANEKLGLGPFYCTSAVPNTLLIHLNLCNFSKKISNN